MQSVRLSRAWLVSALLVVVSLAAFAATPFRGRQFTGFYSVTGVKPQGDLVQLTIHVKLFNHTDADVKGVIVTLLDSTPSMMLRGNFPPVQVWKTHQFITMSQQFTVTKRELDEWNHPGTQPNLVIMYQDSNGKSWQKQAELGRSPMAR